MAGLAAVAIAGRPTAAITAIATSANARCQMVLWAEDDLKVWVLMGLKIVRTAPNRYVSETERASVGNEKLTIARKGIGWAWWALVRGADMDQQGRRWGLPLNQVVMRDFGVRNRG